MVLRAVMRNFFLVFGFLPNLSFLCINLNDPIFLRLKFLFLILMQKIFIRSLINFFEVRTEKPFFTLKCFDISILLKLGLFTV